MKLFSIEIKSKVSSSLSYCCLIFDELNHLIYIFKFNSSILFYLFEKTTKDINKKITPY